MRTYIDFFNSEVERYNKEYDGSVPLRDFVRVDLERFAWYGDNYKDIAKGDTFEFSPSF